MDGRYILNKQVVNKMDGRLTRLNNYIEFVIKQHVNVISNMLYIRVQKTTISR